MVPIADRVLKSAGEVIVECHDFDTKDRYGW